MATSTGVAYARYSTEFQHSIADQIRSIFEYAVQRGIFVPREHVFYDLAISGSKERRPGLDRVRATMARKAARVLLVFTTNRLFRKNYKCMKFVEEEIVGRGLQCIFVRTGIDTGESDRWRLPLQMHAIVDEMTATMYAENIRAAHEGLFLNRFVVSTLPFGYMGQDVPGQLTKRQRPRQIIVIDPDQAKWVRLIFQWFVVDRLPMARIVERLNQQRVPCGPKGEGFWTPHALHYLLDNACYRGEWSYGKGKNVWQGQADYGKRVLRDKPLRTAQFEELRLVSDEIWYAAQRLLASSPQRNAGRKPKDPSKVERPRILNGLLICKEHGVPLKVGGTYGQHMFCTRCRNLAREVRPLYSYLNRSLALRCLCRVMASAIKHDSSLIAELVRPFKHEVEQQQTPDSSVLDRLLARRDKLTRAIEFTLENPGETDADRAESKRRLSHQRAERAQADAEIARIQDAQNGPRRIPTEDDFRQLLDELEAVFLKTATSELPENAGEFRNIVELLTGGQMIVEQMGERRACRGWLRIRAPLRLLQLCAQRLSLSGPRLDEPIREIVVDVREETIAEEHMAEIITLYQDGMLVTAIANQLGIERHQVTDAVQLWHERQGLPLPPDGRVRRATIPKKLLQPSIFENISEEVKRLFDQDLLMEEIAERVGRDRGTVRSTLRHWFTSHNMPMPDMRNRRKTLPRKNRPKNKEESEKS